MRNPLEGVEISPAMQRMADESMQQAKKAFDMYIAGVRQSFRAFGDNNPIASAGERALDLAERNIDAAFAFAQRFVQAKNFQDIIRLQAEYFNSQVQELMQHSAHLAQAADRMYPDKTKSRND